MLAMPLRYQAQVDIDHLDVTAFLNKPAWQSDVNLQARLEGEGAGAAWNSRAQSTSRFTLHTWGISSFTLADRPASATEPLPGTALRR